MVILYVYIYNSFEFTLLQKPISILRSLISLVNIILNRTGFMFKVKRCDFENTDNCQGEFLELPKMGDIHPNIFICFDTASRNSYAQLPKNINLTHYELM